MEILIQKKKFTILDRYEVLKEGTRIFEAITEIVDFQSVINLYENDKQRPVMSIVRNSEMFEYSYDITRWDNNVINFRKCDEGFQFYCEGDKYNLVKNLGRKYSIYKNDVQVAYWDKAELNYFGANKYTMICDIDVSIELVVSLCLIVDNFSKDKSGGGVISVDFGYIGEEAKPFDVNWTPKK